MTLVLGACEVDLERRSVRRAEGGEEALTEQETGLLRYLAERPGRTVARDELLGRVWGYHAKVVTRAVDIAVRRLRQKIEAEPSAPVHVLSVRGVGYRFEPLGTAVEAPGRSRLPHERSTFVGRDAELDALERAHAERLITLVGAPGVGKSRLALRHAHGRWAAGEPVAFADLAQARTAGALLRRVAEALGVPVEPEAGDDAARAQLGLALQARGRLVLLLDDADHVVPAVARAASEWLAQAGLLRIVVTSRERLRVTGERLVAVGPLPASDARALLVARSRAVRAGWGDGEDEVLARIAARLDHNPLALELAAGRAEVLSPGAVLHAIEERFRLLGGGGRDATARQATLYDAIEGSWELLSGWERALLAQLGVFEGGLSPAAAEAVADLSAHPDAPWLVDRLQALVGRSLLGVEEAGVRFRMAESIAAFARDKAKALGLLDGALGRHAAWFLRHGEGLAARRHGRGAAGALAALALEAANLRAALHHAATVGDADAAGRLALALDVLLEVRGPLDERLTVLDTALDALPSAGLAGALLAARAGARSLLGDRDGALSDALAARSTLREGGDDAVRREVLWLLADLHRKSDRGQAKGLAALCAEEAREAEDPRREAHALRLLSRLHWEDGEQDAYARSLDRLRAVSEASGDPGLVASALMQQAFRARVQGRAAEAVALYEQALARAAEVGDRHRTALVEGALGALHASAGALEAALAHYLRCLAINREDGYRRSAMFSASNAGMIAILLGRIDEAEALTRDAVAHARALGTPDALGMRLANRALLRRVQGEVAEARLDLEAALDHFVAADERFSHAYFSAHAAAVCADLGDVDAARRHLVSTEPLAAEAGALLYARVAEGHVALAAGDRAEAERALAEARAWRAQEAAVGPILRSVLSAEGDLAVDLLARRIEGVRSPR